MTIGEVETRDTEEVNPPESSKILKCPECGSTNLFPDEEAGELVCMGCGLVIVKDMLDTGKDWRVYTDEERKKRVRAGSPTSFSIHDKGLPTSIRVEKDAFGRPLSPKVKEQMWRLRKHQIYSRVHNSRERNLAQALNELNRLCDKLYIPDNIHEDAAILYREVLDRGLVRGRSINGVMAACLYVEFRKNAIPRKLNELAKASLETKSTIARYYRLILKELDIRLPIQEPSTYVESIGEIAGCPESVCTLAYRILDEAEERHISVGKHPIGLAAAALYTAGIEVAKGKDDADKKKYAITQRKLAEASGVTEVTVRNLYRPFKEELGYGTKN